MKDHNQELKIKMAESGAQTSRAIVMNKGFAGKITGFLERFPVIYQFLRFGCIGALNTGLNFLILNTLSKALGVSQGWPLGGVEVVAFVGAVIQSYFWNRTWTFGSEQGVSIIKNFIRLVMVGALGFLAFVFVLIGSKFFAPWYFFAIELVVYLVFESALWRTFGFHISDWNHESHSFFIFFLVTLIGLGINTVLVSVISLHLHLTHTDLDKNISAFLAVCVSLFWNFIGYKLIVFKK